jgi:hypothetical protein
LVWVAKTPEGLGRSAEAIHPRVRSAIEDSQSAVLLRVIEGNALLRVLSGCGKLSEVKERVPQCYVGLDKESGV